MAASTLTTVSFANDTDVHFRAWASAIDAAIIAGGWTDNGDSGQINLVTVLAPVAINTSQGYKIYKSPNEGGLSNFYLKLEFGSGAVSASRPAVWITLGFQGTDGAGNLLSTINPISTRTQVAEGATPAGASISINMAAGVGYICICATSSLAAEHLVFSIERTKDVNLAFQDQINIFASIAGVFGAACYAQSINKLNAFPAFGAINTSQALTSNNASMPPNANTPIAGIVALGILFGMAVGATSPSINIFGVEDTALGVYQDTITVTILGVNHNYKLQRILAFAQQVTTVLLSRFE